MEVNYVYLAYPNQDTFLVFTDVENSKHKLHDLLKAHLE